MPAPGERLTLAIERPAVGGRMIARLDGAIVLVAGAIPGERVEAIVERAQRGTVFARTVRVLEASADRVDVDPRRQCAGHVLAHVRAERQAGLKAEMIADAFRRIGRVDVGVVPVATGPAGGYRTRARVHVRRGRWGFFEDGTHELCAIADAGQVRDDSVALLDALCAEIAPAAGADGAEVEWAESLDGAQRVAHVHLLGRRRVAPLPARPGLDGLWWSSEASPIGQAAFGTPFVVDEVRGANGRILPVRHHVRAFFQGNRYLLQALVDDVAGRVTAGDVADLYSGVGLFGLRLAADGHLVHAVEGDRWAAADLAVNAAGPAASGRLTAHQATVERAVGAGRLPAVETVVVDPPRTGLAPEVTAALTAEPIRAMVYVSCDPATLARDVRRCLEAGFTLGAVRGVDLFPGTGHVETVVTLTR